MGSRLVKRAYAYAVDVPLHPNEFRLLAWMCLTALDEDSPPRYFDSREASAIALGRRVPDEDSPERSAAFEAVKVAVRGLAAVGAIRRLKAGHRGQRAEYAIEIDVAASRRTPECRRRQEGSPFPKSKARPSPIRRLTLPHSEGSPFPQGTTRSKKEPTDEIPPLNGTTSPGPVDNSSRGEVA